MLEIALADRETGIFQKDIALNQEISVKYLDHIISSLKRAGLVANVAGRKSGYRLTRPAEQISMMDIFKAFESRLTVNDCIHDDFDCSRRRICGVMNFWSELNDTIEFKMASTTLADIVARQSSMMPK